MFDAIAAHIEWIHGYHILGKVVADAVINTKFPVDGILGSQADR